MELSEEELNCIKYFPKRNDLPALSFFDFFETNFLRISGIKEEQLSENIREKFFTHEISKNSSFKKIGKDFLVEDCERFMKFVVHFVDDIGYEIYINKDNPGENRLHLLNDFYYDKLMISDLQTEKLLTTENVEEIKNSLLMYMNLYKRFEIFRNSIECYLKDALKENGYWGHFIYDSEGDFYHAKKNKGLIYSYGKRDKNMPEEIFDFSEKRNVLIPFDNFVPILNTIIEDIRKNPA